MHWSSYEKMLAFRDFYLDDFRETTLRILDIGSQAPSQEAFTYARVFDSPSWEYTGLDIEAGYNVDVVAGTPFSWDSLDSDHYDLVVSGQALEHVTYFWATAFEMVRVTKPGGLIVVVVPSSGYEHRYPVDCWRFYPDGLTALAEYVECLVVDVFTDWERGNWQDSIVVMRKPLWDAAGRKRFQLRHWHQMAIVHSPEAELPPEIEQDGPIVDSPLSQAVGRGFAERLAELRDRGILDDKRDRRLQLLKSIPGVQLAVHRIRYGRQKE